MVFYEAEINEVNNIISARRLRGSTQIATIDIQTNKRRVLTSGAGEKWSPRWLAEGRIAYVSGGPDGGVNVETNEVKALTNGSNHDNFPSWSPTGERIAFTSDLEGDYEIYTIKPDGTDLRRLTHAAGNDAHCAWSPDGQWIAFASARGGFKDEAALHPYNPQPYGDVYVMRADGSDVRMLTDNQFEEATPSWVPMRRKRSKGE